MLARKRIYDAILADHLAGQRQMAFISGPRQVGKTTTCRGLSQSYLNWDNSDHRKVIMAGPTAVAEAFGLDRLAERTPVAMFDELHKFRRWKAFLKGFYDTYADRGRFVVTGSSRLDIYRRGGDSLMGRYFLYRMHPFTVAEVLHQNLPDLKRIVRDPGAIGEADFGALWEHGGFPEPFLKRDDRFTRRWRQLRSHQLLREDLRDLTQISELGQLETLVSLLGDRSGDQLIYSNLAGDVKVSVDTIRRWVNTLCMLQVGFLLRPWHRNVSRALRKEPKWFLRDWSGIADPGKRAETFVACHLLKAVEGWNDLGLSNFQLGYLRDTSTREIDFIVVRDDTPWILIEVKLADGRISPALRHFQEQTAAPVALQVVVEAEYVDADCLAQGPAPLVVPARTLLSQLL